MNRFDDLGHRRREQLNAPPDFKPDLFARFLDGLILIVGLLAFLAVLGWVQTRDADDANRHLEASHPSTRARGLKQGD